MSLLEFNSKRIDNFIRLARNSMFRLQVLILCEGSDDIDTLQALIGKLNVQLPRYSGVSDCGGISKLEELAPFVATICNLRKRTRKIVLIIDANTRTAQQRVNSLKQSLESHHVRIENLHQVSDSIYGATFERFDFLIKAVGKMDLPFKSHEMEDYAVYLLRIKAEVGDNQLVNFHKASDFIKEHGKKADVIIEESEESDVRKAYENIIDLLNTL